jgi:hypothetical protein
VNKEELAALGKQGAQAILQRRSEKPSDFQIAYSLAAGALALAADLTVPEMLGEDVFRNTLAKNSVSEATFRAAVTEARKHLKAAKREAEEQANQASLPKVGRRRKNKGGVNGALTPQRADTTSRSGGTGTPFPAERISNHSTEGL